MSFEDTARKAGHDLREASTAHVEAALADFQRAVPRRRRVHAGVALVTVAAALVIALTASRWLIPDDPRNAQPAPQPEVTASSPTSIGYGYGCENTLIACHGNRRSTVAMRVPMNWQIPREFTAPYSGAGPTTTLVESYTNRGAPGGVTVLQGVNVATTQQIPDPVPDVQSAESFALWLAQRDFLSASQVHTSSIDGYPAWSVDVVVKPDQPPGPADCTQSIACYPIMLLDGDIIGTWEGMASRYTALDLPGAGVTVVWSWGLNGKIPQAADDLIASIRFE